jgi:hypothetical protein
LTSFSTIGPIVCNNNFTGDDIVLNPNEQKSFYITLQNNGSVTAAKNIKAELSCSDSLVSLINYNISYADIPAGESAKSNKKYWIYIPEDYPVNSVIPIVVHISSDELVYWTDTIYFNVLPTAIKDIRKQICNIYPNPFVDMLSIELDVLSPNLTIDLFDITGKVVYSEILDNPGSSHTINFSSLEEGIYFIRISSNEYTLTKKIIKVE